MQHFLVTYVDENNQQLGDVVPMVRASAKEVAPEKLDLIIRGVPVLMDTHQEIIRGTTGNPPVTKVVVHCARPAVV
jgi:hypothetical protein